MTIAELLIPFPRKARTAKPATTARVVAVQDRPVHDRSGLDRSAPDRSAPDRSGLDHSGRDRTDQRAAALSSLDRMHRLPIGDPERAALRDQVIAEYMPYARHVASRYGTHRQSSEDVLQAAYVGLVKAVDGFDPDYGAAFLAYATPTILGELKRFFRDTTWMVHVPRRVQELSGELRTATEALSQRLNRAPTVLELAELLEVDPADVIDAMDAVGLHSIASLDLPVSTGDGDGSALGDLLGADDPDLQNVVDRETLRPLLAALSPRAKQILLMRFFRGMTQSEIGLALGVSQMQVSRLLADILGKLRHSAGADSDAGASAVAFAGSGTVAGTGTGGSAVPATPNQSRSKASPARTRR